MTWPRLLAAAIVVGAAATVSAMVRESPAAEVQAATPRQSYDDLNAPYDGLYHFVRVRYSSGGGGFGRRRGGAMWAHDYPRAERNFLSIMGETTFVRSQTEGSNVLAFDDPEIFKYPITYIVEVGFWNPTDAEAESLREYLLK